MSSRVITGRRSTWTPRRWPSPATRATRLREGYLLSNMALWHVFQGDYRQAIDLDTQALAIARGTGDRPAEVISWAT